MIFERGDRFKQKIVFFEIDPSNTSKDSNPRIAKIDLLKPKKSHGIKYRLLFFGPPLFSGRLDYIP